jgi:CxxC motif-containing protein (DUF1111 family)
MSPAIPPSAQAGISARGARVRRGGVAMAVVAALAAVAACGGPREVAIQESDYDAASGGLTTVGTVSRDSFTLPAADITDTHRRDFMIGQAVFNENWVTAPSNNRDHQGLGPLFNARSCSSCHGKAGRARPPDAEDPTRVGLLFRLSIPGEDAHGAPVPEPTYGGQFHPLALSRLPPDGTMAISYTEEAGTFGDGAAFSLRRPEYRFATLNYGAMAAEVQVSPRIGPALVGLGLLEAVPEADIRARAARPADADGVHGHCNAVWDVRAGRVALGRFGWKANQPTLEQQCAGALNGDIGIISELFPHENTTPAHVAALARPSGGENGAPEISALKLQRLIQWAHLLGVPRRRNVDDPQVRRGAQVFANCRCDACHAPVMTTGDGGEFPELAHQVIHPYTDLLLHDLGEGLADHRADYAAGPREWRTPPLWGIGLTETVNGHHQFLHDGRARDVGEAILWHGGEGLAARERFRTASAADRAALLAFLGSL